MLIGGQSVTTRSFAFASMTTRRSDVHFSMREILGRNTMTPRREASAADCLARGAREVEKARLAELSRCIAYAERAVAEQSMKLRGLPAAGRTLESLQESLRVLEDERAEIVEGIEC